MAIRAGGFLLPLKIEALNVRAGRALGITIWPIWKPKPRQGSDPWPHGDEAPMAEQPEDSARQPQDSARQPREYPRHNSQLWNLSQETALG